MSVTVFLAVTGFVVWVTFMACLFWCVICGLITALDIYAWHITRFANKKCLSKVKWGLFALGFFREWGYHIGFSFPKHVTMHADNGEWLGVFDWRTWDIAEVCTNPAPAKSEQSTDEH